MVKTKSALSSSSGTTLFLGVALLLLPTAFGFECHWTLSQPEKCDTRYQDEKYCATRWTGFGDEPSPVGCVSETKFRSDYGFSAEDGCGEIPQYKPYKVEGVFACACSFYQKDLCNDPSFGVDKYNEWKANKEGGGTTKGPGDGGYSSGLRHSNLVPVTLAALLTTAILGR